MDALNYTPWQVEQTQFLPDQEANIERQMAFSNGYLSQYAYFEEHYSGEQSLGTFIDGIDGSTPNLTTVSIRLHDELLNLHYWQVDDFRRTLSRQEPALERQMTVTSPKGNTIRVTTHRRLDTDNPSRIYLDYSVESVNYEGPITILSLLGDGDKPSPWQPLLTEISETHACIRWRSELSPVHVCAAIAQRLYKDDRLLNSRFMRIEKKRILGYAITEHIRPNQSIRLEKTIAVSDSRRVAKEHLSAHVISLIPTA